MGCLEFLIKKRICAICLLLILTLVSATSSQFGFYHLTYEQALWSVGSRSLRAPAD